MYDQVSISTWEEGNSQPHQDYSVSIDSSSAIMRNPFSEKKWRKFQISRLFNSSNAATKLHVIDVNLNHGAARVVDRWLVALSLGSGQTRNMALDRYVMQERGYRFLSYICHCTVCSLEVKSWKYICDDLPLLNLGSLELCELFEG